jgi:hypothetical protein
LNDTLNWNSDKKLPPKKFLTVNMANSRPPSSLSNSLVHNQNKAKKERKRKDEYTPVNSNSRQKKMHKQLSAKINMSIEAKNSGSVKKQMRLTHCSDH